MYTYNQLIFPSQLEDYTRFYVLAGFASNGPVGTPFALKPDTNPYDVLGNCQMTENYLIAREYGIHPLLLRLNGSHGEAVLVHEQSNTPVLQFKTLEATDECNHMMIHLFPTHMVLKGRYQDFIYYFSDYKDLRSLVTAIKEELYYAKGEVDVELLQLLPLEGLCLTEKFIPFEGADDGFHLLTQPVEILTEEKLQAQIQQVKDHFVEVIGEESASASGINLTGEWEIGVDTLTDSLEASEPVFVHTGELSSYTVDTLVFTDIPYEKAPAELLRIFGGFAKSKTNEQSLFCSIVLGSDSFQGGRWNEEGEDTYTDALQLLYQAKEKVQSVANQEHVEVVIGRQNGLSNRINQVSAAGSYAARRFTQDRFYDSPTNQPHRTISALYSDELKQDEVAKLSGTGYICFVPSRKHGFVPFSTKNLSSNPSIFSKPHYLRSIYYDLRMMAEFFNQTLGEPMNILRLQGILLRINQYIEMLLDNHPLYKNITIDVVDYKAEQIHLSLLFEVYGEVEAVRTSFDYSPTREVISV